MIFQNSFGVFMFSVHNSPSQESPEEAERHLLFVSICYVMLCYVMLLCYVVMLCYVMLCYVTVITQVGGPP